MMKDSNLQSLELHENKQGIMDLSFSRHENFNFRHQKISNYELLVGVLTQQNSYGHTSQTGPKKCFIPKIVKNTPILIQQSIACNVYT